MLKKAKFDDEKLVWNAMLSGELDAINSPEMVEDVISLLNERKAGLVFNCSQLDFIDSMGLGALVKIRKMVEEYGGTVSFTHMKKRIFKLFVITGLDNSFVIEVE